MPRSGEKVRRRLQQAALDLYRKHGFDETTTAQIAAKAKVTERTFFRHFADKREVLFDGEATLIAAMVHAVKEAPDDLPPLPTLLRSFRSIVPIVEKNRPFLEPRMDVIAINPALRERALAKVASLKEALAAALHERGVGERPATLAAEIAMAAYSQAAEAWGKHPSQKLEGLLLQAFDDLHALASVDVTPAKKNRRSRSARS